MVRELGEYEAGTGTIYYVIGAQRAGKKQYKADLIKTITFVQGNEVPANAVDSWDVSFNNGDYNVRAWVIKNSSDNSMYDLYIGADSKIVAPSISDRMFRAYTNCISINGLEFLDTSKATSMNYMFMDSDSLTTLDLSYFDTSKVTQMMYMFSGCKALKNVDLSSFDTTNVTTMTAMFRYCENMTDVTFGNSFKTNKVTDMSYMFSRCSKLTKIDLSKFDTSSATNVDSKSGYINYAAAPANVWTTFSYIYEVTDRSIGGKINAVSIGQSGPSATQPNTPVMLIDNVKVELLNGSEELEISKNAVLTVENDVPDTTVNAASITGIVSSGAFNKGDSVLINLDTITSFKKTVSDVKFYVNGEEYKATGNKGSSYSLKLINLDEGDYTVYGEVTFSDGESVSSSEETFTIAGGKSYSADAPSVRGSLASGNLVVSKRIKNNLTTDATGVIIAAVYDSNGNLIKVAKGNVTEIAAGFENDLSVSLEKIGTVPSGSYVKVMVWSDMTNMLPLVSADILS